MKHTLLYLLLCGLCLLSLAIPVWAADAASTATEEEVPITVTATRTEKPIDQVASSVTVITEAQIQATNEPFVVDVLRDTVPGLMVTQSGGPGGYAQLYLRGGDPSQTLVMIDGVPLNEPDAYNGSYDLSTLTTDNIARIEVLRGPQSTLYGSKAMAGVINIITKRGNGKPKTSLTLSGGSFTTGEGSLTSSGSGQKWNYSFSGSRYSTAGFPSAPGGVIPNGYYDTTLSTRVGEMVNKDFSFNLIGRYTNARAQQNNENLMTGALVDDGEQGYNTEQTTMRAEGHWRPGQGKWENIFAIESDEQSHFYNDTDQSINPGPGPPMPNKRGPTMEKRTRRNGSPIILPMPATSSPSALTRKKIGIMVTCSTTPNPIVPSPPPGCTPRNNLPCSGTG